jgi:hypothetical protein
VYHVLGGDLLYNLDFRALGEVDLPNPNARDTWNPADISMDNLEFGHTLDGILAIQEP